MMVQRVKNKLARSVGLKEGFTDTFDPSLPALMVNDGYLKTNSTGTALEYIAQADLINTISTGSQAFTASRALVSDSNGLATQSATTSTEIGYVSGVTSALQTQINAKQDTITGAASTVVSSNLTANRAVISGAAGKLTTTTVTHTELDYISGVTSAIQTQLNAKITNPMTTGGDLIYGGASGAPTRLANGTSGQVLTSAGGTSAPTWSNPYKTVGAKILAAGTVSDENFNWINGNASVATSTFTITLVGGFFASISSVQVSIIGDVAAGFLGTSSVVSASTSTIVVSFSTVGTGNIARDFYITVVGT